MPRKLVHLIPVVLVAGLVRTSLGDVLGQCGPDAGDRSREAVMEAFRAGRTIAYFNNMLCAHEWVLRLLMASLVDVRLTEVEDGRAFLRLQNNGPVELTAQIAGMPLAPVILGPYQKVLVGMRRTPDTVTITWTNLYIRSTQNLTITHALLAPASQDRPSGQR